MSAKSPTNHNEELQALLREGFVLLSRGQLQKAGDCCRRILEIKPDLVQGHFLIGLVALEAKDRDTAFRAFASVTKLQKNHSAAWAHLAKLFISDGQVNRADAALAEAAKNDPQDPMVQDLLGSIFSLMGEHGLARSWFEKATTARPDHPPFMLNRANNLIYHGETGEAETALGEIIVMQANSPQAHWALASVRKARDRQHIEQMQLLLAQKSQPPRVQAFYYYGIGKELEDLQEWDDAFEAFSRGAAVRRTTVAYDEAAEIEMFAFLEKHFTADWLADGSTGDDSAAPIFVLGQPRTGTTLIERIISSHSHVHSAGELQQFSLAIRRLSDHKDPKRFSAGFFEASLGVDCKRIGATYMESTKRMRGTRPRFVDKLPQNYLLIPLILKALPNAKIVHLQRDPMDACFSSYKQLFADAYLHSYDLREMARHHARYRRLMDVWRERFSGSFHDISYESTVSDLEPNARELVEYLGLPWEDAALRFHEQNKAVSTASAVQVREPVHTRSVGRWRKYEKQLESMRDELTRQGID
ncbi:MAG: tetratricopeptide repeat protein [Gammaproteobacteria bacterium]|nr:tetratricopeptide repeat protein [Gammaproteobacteria bacterium]